MKIFSVILAFSTCMIMAACSDTTDCVCTINTANGQQQTTLSDWDGNCANITSNDIENLANVPCYEE
jgi:hypothetical protein